MPRPRNAVPTYRRHRASGQAFIRIAGRDTYLGVYGSPESKAEYERICAAMRKGQPPPGKAGSLTVAELMRRFKAWADGYYRHPDGRPTSEAANLRDALLPVLDLYADLPAAEFGPLALKAARQRMIGNGWTRKNINARVNRVRRMFRWAASEELVDGSVLVALKTVAPLAKGRTTAKESEPVLPVPDAVVDATLPALYPTVAAMVRVQRLTGMRPGEVRTMTPGQIDRTGKLWVYAPDTHKTSHRGKSRPVNIGPKAQKVLAPFLKGKAPGEPVFTPAAALAERYAAMRAARKSKVQPSQASRAKPAAKKARQVPTAFTISGYVNHVKRGCKRAGVAPWHPNQLRHTFATAVRKRYDFETAGAALGHDKMSATEVYAERDSELAERVAREMG